MENFLDLQATDLAKDLQVRPGLAKCFGVGDRRPAAAVRTAVDKKLWDGNFPIWDTKSVTQRKNSIAC